MIPSPLKNCFRNLFFLAGAGVLGLSGMDLSTLTARSPFAPAGSGRPEAVPAEAAQLEFRSIASDQGGMMFSIFDATANRGHWLRMGEAGFAVVKSYDSAQNQIEVEHQGKIIQLRLKRATIQVGAAMPVPVMAQMPGLPVNKDANGQVAPTDARRLEAVAAEVRRRRALRTVAQTPASAGATATTPVPADSSTLVVPVPPVP